MQRRQFLKTLSGLGLGALAFSTSAAWCRPRIINPCLSRPPDALTQHPLLQAVWEGLDTSQVWDCHTHLIGAGDSGSGVWFNPDMGSLQHPQLYLQKWLYTNAGCVNDAPGHSDTSYVERLHSLIQDMPAGFKAMLYAFDWRYDQHGTIDKQHAIFHIPDAYAASIAQRMPQQFEWVASIHPYRQDCVEALQQAVQHGARAIKWLPSAMGIDPASPLCDRFYTALAQSGLPLISHPGRELAVQGGNQDDGNPLKLRRAMDHGIRVVFAHCASDGDDLDFDRGPHGPRVKSHTLFARLMDDPQYAHLAFADISALTQRNRAWALKEVLERTDWHPRLLNGSDYPLPGILPLFSASAIADMGLLDPAAVAPLEELRQYNALLFDFTLKRLVASGKTRFPNSVFETRAFFEIKAEQSLAK
jgi:predicted TIM-barrel fold metal-dependent hydrolase